MKKLRVGVLGTGAFAEACHVPGLQSHPDAEVVVLCGRNSERTRAMADRVGVPEIALDYEQVCSRKDIDAVTIATPNVAHAIQAKAAFAAGKHVFCEKPLGMNVHEVIEMVRAAEQSRTIHQVAFTYRYLYGVQELKRRLLKGDIGEPYHVRKARLCGRRNFVRCRISPVRSHRLYYRADRGGGGQYLVDPARADRSEDR
jgi:predicted dehydrogenase